MLLSYIAVILHAQYGTAYCNGGVVVYERGRFGSLVDIWCRVLSFVREAIRRNQGRGRIPGLAGWRICVQYPWRGLGQSFWEMLWVACPVVKWLLAGTREARAAASRFTSITTGSNIPESRSNKTIKRNTFSSPHIKFYFYYLDSVYCIPIERAL